MSESRYFQWIAGDRKGEILVLDNIVEDSGSIYLSFKDGSRMNEEFIAQINQRDLTRKLMAEIDSPQNCWRFVEKTSPDDKPRVEKDANSGEYYEIWVGLDGKYISYQYISYQGSQDYAYYHVGREIPKKGCQLVEVFRGTIKTISN